MTKRRLGVALLVPPPLDVEIDGLRRAVGDGALGRIPAHLTLVPPVNVREDRLDDAVAVLRRAAAAAAPFEVDLGPPATFLPINPVLYLALAGRGQDDVQRNSDKGNVLVARGWRVLHFTWGDVRRRAAYVVDAVARELALACPA